MGITIEELKKYKRISGLTNKEISERSGVGFGTVQKIFGGATRSPRYDTMAALEKVLVPAGSPDALNGAHTGNLQDGAARYQYGAGTYGWSPDPVRQGHYTIGDRELLDNGIRTELIDGVLYVMQSPTIYHQTIVQEALDAFRKAIDAGGGRCMVFGAPLDMQLSEDDDRNMLQPDLMVVCGTDRLRRKGIMGAPDLVLEVLSPSTRKRDLTVKYMKYAETGVREYWVCDPDRKTVVVYDLEHEELPVLYGRDTGIPVSIWDNKAEIDFVKIWDRVEALEEIIGE